MRIERFQSTGQTPLGTGNERKVFVNPKNEQHIIAENQSESKESERSLKGTYYLTKIVHHLLPNNIPDIYQVGEAKPNDGGVQTTDRERIAHTPSHEAFQQARKEDQDIPAAVEMTMIEDMGEEMGALDMKLDAVGLGFNIDGGIGNYTRGEDGNVYYLEPFRPWQKDVVNLKELEVLFEEDSLREAINKLPEEKSKNECLRYLDRLLALLEEERTKLREQKEPERPDCRERVEAFETKYTPYFSEETLAHLNAIASVSEALADMKRKAVKIVLGEILTELQALKSETNISDAEFERLFAKRNALMRAFGTLRSDGIDRSEPK